MSGQRVSLGPRDLISSLPDEVLGKILSLLPTKLSASTSVLSKRWRNLLTLVDNLEFNDAIGDPRGFSDFVDKTLALLTNSLIVKSFSLNCEHKHEKSRVESWIATALKRGFLELHLESVCIHFIETECFTSNTLVKLTLTLSDMPYGGVFFPKLKTLSLVLVGLVGSEVYEHLISGCPEIEELFIHYADDPLSARDEGMFCPSTIVSSPTIKRLSISYRSPGVHVAPDAVWLKAPSLVYLDYSSYVTDGYQFEFGGSLVEAKLDLRFSGERVLDVGENGNTENDDDSGSDDSEDDDDSDDDGGEDVNLCDVTDLVAGISNVKTLHLSPESLEVLQYDCKSMPVFHNLLTLSFESDKERGWQVLPLLLNNSPSLETLVIKGLVHKVTDRCGNACVCINKKKKKMEEVCCLLTCQVKVLNILGYGGSLRELKQMRHFLGNLKCLETVKVKVVVEVDLREDSNVYSNYTRITNALTKLPRVSSKCQIHFV